MFQDRISRFFQAAGRPVTDWWTRLVNRHRLPAAYRSEKLSFGPDYLIPKPFDPRLIGIVASSVARAAMETGVATRPIADMDAYRHKLDGSVYKSALIMRPVFEASRHAKRRIVFAEGEDDETHAAEKLD